MFNKIKLWYNCKKSGREEEYKDFKRYSTAANNELKMYINIFNDAKEKFSNVKAKFLPNTTEYEYAKNEVNRWKYVLEEKRLALKYIRPNSKEDIQYRDKQANEFTNKLKAVLSPKLDLRFHGTPIYFAEQIIKSGNISSSADRYDGFIKSTDMLGEISASTINTIGRTIDFFSDIVAYQRQLPCGCIFALLPKDEKDATLGVDIMQSVDFRKNPEQLFGIFTSPENIKMVKEWMNTSGLNADLVYTFEGFLQATKRESEKLEFKQKTPQLSKEFINNMERENNLNRDKLANTGEMDR